MGLVNAIDSSGNEIWAGVNEAGFAIMNSASYNLKAAKDTTKLKDREGLLMKLALKICRNLSDFETLLDTLPKPLGVESNFGVIDASGGAAYYETDNYHYTKLDVNDPRVAPSGYLIHTNYSFTGRINEGYGYIRFQMAQNLFQKAVASNQLTPEFILQQVSRSLKHGLTGVDLTQSKQDFAILRDYIPRRSSVSVILIKGVKAGENPARTVMWAMPGFPLTSVAMPLWVANMDDLPAILLPGPDHRAPLCQAALQLKKQCFPIRRGSGPNYLNLPVVWNAAGTGILQKILSFEKQLFEQTTSFTKKFAKDNNSISANKLKDFYRKLEKQVIKFYRRNFKINLEEQ